MSTVLLSLATFLLVLLVATVLSIDWGAHYELKRLRRSRGSDWTLRMALFGERDA